jgi:hypothetical protein
LKVKTTVQQAGTLPIEQFVLMEEAGQVDINKMILALYGLEGKCDCSNMEGFLRCLISKLQIYADRSTSLCSS